MPGTTPSTPPPPQPATRAAAHNKPRGKDLRTFMNTSCVGPGGRRTTRCRGIVLAGFGIGAVVYSLLVRFMLDALGELHRWRFLSSKGAGSGGRLAGGRVAWTAS